MIYAVSLVLWVIAEAQHVLDGCVCFFLNHQPAPPLSRFRQHRKQDNQGDLLEKQLTDVAVETPPPSSPRSSIWPTYHELLHNDLTRCLSMDATALAANRATLRNVVELGSIMMWWYCVDRTNLLGSGTKTTRLLDLWAVFAVLTGVAAVTSIRQAKAPVLLNRTQTEEWKGWMQVLFLLYHYFQTHQLYNAIRVFIAAYVWMTGFGNFAYYYKTNDFHLPR